MAHNPDEAGIEKDDRQMPILPDLRSHTIWDTIRNTIEDPTLTLYLVLDEAHRGMQEGRRSNGDSKPTIVRQLINGTGSVPGIPVVWGISATVQRFNDAIAGMQGRGTLANVVVDSKKVQDSGLLKDTINLDVPEEEGKFSTVLVRRGTEKLRESSNAWAEYAKQQDDAEIVLPLMVLHVPNSLDHNEIGTWLDTIFERWPELPHDCVANVFGEHKTETFGSRSAPYIAPERVQESDWVRILVAKDAISTGWDCPRAEVMVSLRAASDKTHITQLLGRMVRTPLARRIRARYGVEINKARQSVLIVEGKTLRADLRGKDWTFDDFLEAADYAVIEDAFKRACRVISPDLAKTYSEYLADKESAEEDPEDALIEAHTAVAAMGLVPDIKTYLEAEAEKLAKLWLGQFRVEIKSLSDERQDIYREIKEMSTDPIDVDLARPRSRLQPTTIRERDGKEVELPRFEKHLLCDGDGLFPEDFNSWEDRVLFAELRRKETIAWYRNPSWASQDSLGITYEGDGETKIVRPDFIFFARLKNGTIAADIVDPHGAQYADALPKLKGLARYAGANGTFYRRIEAIAKVGEKFRALDLTEAATREAVLAATDIANLYEGRHAADYFVG